jgi:3-dehydroquinate synthase
MQEFPSYFTISNNLNDELRRSIADIKADKVVWLVDENTRKHCLPKIDISHEHVIEIQSGETHKNLKTCQDIWSALTAYGCSRKSLLINLGGGVIGDMGGFCASTFKRGISFINLPTTLLSQVDASIGGKLGVDFHDLKNHIGLFRDPDRVIISTDFLETLPERELLSGFAEVIKHALIHDTELWKKLTKYRTLLEAEKSEIIKDAIAIKYAIVSEDPLEKGVRKKLNFGHTLGHALETHFLNSSNPLLHGEAVILGMILESRLSNQLKILASRECKEIITQLEQWYSALSPTIPGYTSLEPYLLQDKKNIEGKLKFALIDNIGSCLTDVDVLPSQLDALLNE